MIATAIWATTLVACLLALAFLRAGASSTHPTDDVRLVPGASAWEPLAHAQDEQMVVDAVELPDGRIARTAVVSMEQGKPRPCEIWDPKTRLWSRGLEVVPPSDPATSSLRSPALTAAIPAGSVCAMLDPDSALVVAPGAADATDLVLEPGHERLPSVPARLDVFRATRLSSGGLAVCATTSAAAPFTAILRTDRKAWDPLPPPPVAVARELHGGPNDSLVLVAGFPIRFAVFSGGSWRECPPLPEARTSATTLVARDGTIYVMGGDLAGARHFDRPLVRGAQGLALLGVLVLIGIAVAALRGSRLSTGELAGGLFLGFVVIPAIVGTILGALGWLLLQFGWH